METRPPSEALPCLEELARLSLCQEVHKRFQEQADGIIEEWTRAIHEAPGQYNGSLQPGVRFQDPYRDGTENLRVDVAHLRGITESERAASNLGTNERPAIQRSYQQMTAERDTLSRQAAEPAPKLREAEEHLTHLSQELDQAKRECTSLSKEVESLTTQLDSEAHSSNKYRAETQTQHKLLFNIVEDLQSQLNHTQQQSKTLAADLKQAIDSQTMLSAENATLHTQPEIEHEKCAKLSAELEKLQLNHTETDTLRTELARQSQATAEWRQAQSDLKISAEAHDALKISSAQKEKDLSSSIATLTGQLNVMNTTKEHLSTANLALGEAEAKLVCCKRSLEEMTASNTETNGKLSRDNTALTEQIDSERKTSTQLREELKTTQDELSAATLDLGESQNKLEKCLQDFDELRASDSEKERELSATIEELTGQIDRVHKTSAKQLQDLCTTKDELSDAKLALEKCQASVEKFQREADELKTAVAEKEVLSASNAALTDQIDFFKRHPFKAVCTSLGSTWMQASLIRGNTQR